MVNALLLLWGIAILFFRTREAQLQNVTGWILIAIGAIILLWGFFGRGREPEPEVAEAPQEVASKVESVEETRTHEAD
jgi:protein-S-isoprenylcysteine O-methyltransferase Ste14